jgi:hypothetical protein
MVVVRKATKLNICGFTAFVLLSGFISRIWAFFLFVALGFLRLLAALGNTHESLFTQAHVVNVVESLSVMGK